MKICKKYKSMPVAIGDWSYSQMMLVNKLKKSKTLNSI